MGREGELFRIHTYIYIYPHPLDLRVPLQLHRGFVPSSPKKVIRDYQSAFQGSLKIAAEDSSDQLARTLSWESLVQHSQPSDQPPRVTDNDSEISEVVAFSETGPGLFGVEPRDAALADDVRQRAQAWGL